MTNREQMSDFKLRGMNPLVYRVITPSAASFYLKGQASEYPTAWLDIDGNERTAVHLRNSDLNQIHILLQQLARADLVPAIRKAAAANIFQIIDRHRSDWSKTVAQLQEELTALDKAIKNRKATFEGLPKKLNGNERALGEDKASRRLRRELQEWIDEGNGYREYLSHLQALLAFEPDATRRFTGKISQLIPEMSLGDNNAVRNLEHYVAGPSPGGLITGEDGQLDEERSFRCLNYFSFLTGQRARNNPQRELSQEPIDFTAMALPDASYVKDSGQAEHAYWLYGDENSQLVILQDASGRLCLRPVRNLRQNEDGQVRWAEQAWRAGLPLRLFEDPELQLPPNADRAAWLCAWHSEQEWFSAILMG
ncbi:MAG: hypothetical protein M3Y72_25805 [Acidobacteriota bacterium]|nr:hypothetical protein [Acidobacteriota bacterium]